MDASKLKSELEKVLRITKWNPTEAQLNEIADKLSQLDSPHTTADVSSVVLSVVDSYESICLEGIDTTDTSTLLALAIQATKNTKKS